MRNYILLLRKLEHDYQEDDRRGDECGKKGHSEGEETNYCTTRRIEQTI